MKRRNLQSPGRLAYRVVTDEGYTTYSSPRKDREQHNILSTSKQKSTVSIHEQKNLELRKINDELTGELLNSQDECRLLRQRVSQLEASMSLKSLTLNSTSTKSNQARLLETYQVVQSQVKDLKQELIMLKTFSNVMRKTHEKLTRGAIELTNQQLKDIQEAEEKYRRLALEKSIQVDDGSDVEGWRDLYEEQTMDKTILEQKVAALEDALIRRDGMYTLETDKLKEELHHLIQEEKLDKESKHLMQKEIEALNDHKYQNEQMIQKLNEKMRKKDKEIEELKESVKKVSNTSSEIILKEMTVIKDEKSSITEKYKEKKNKLKKLIQNLKSERDQKEAEVNSLSESVTKFSTKTRELSSKLKQSNHDISQLQTTILENEEQIRLLTNEVDHLKKKNEASEISVESEISDMRQEVDMLTELIAKQTSTISILQQSLQDRDDEVSEANKKLEQERKHNKAEMDQLQRLVEAYEEEKQELRNRVNLLSVEKLEISEDRDNTVEEMLREIEELTAEKNNLSENMSALHNTLESNSLVIIDLNAKLEKLKRKKSEKESDASKEVDDLRLEMAQKSEQLQRLSATISMLHNSIEESDEENAKLREKIEQLSKNRSSSAISKSNEILKLTEELDRRRREISDLSVNNQKLQKELELTKELLSSMTKDAELDNKKRSAIDEETREKLTELMQSGAIKDSELSKMQNEILDLKATITAERELHNKQIQSLKAYTSNDSDTSNLKTTIGTLKDKLAEANAKIDEMHKNSGRPDPEKVRAIAFMMEHMQPSEQSTLEEKATVSKQIRRPRSKYLREKLAAEQAVLQEEQSTTTTTSASISLFSRVVSRSAPLPQDSVPAAESTSQPHTSDQQLDTQHTQAASSPVNNTEES